MNQLLTKDGFYKITKLLVDDAFAFLETDDADDFRRRHVPDYQYRYLHIEPRRRIGKTWTIQKLVEDYPSVLLVFPDSRIQRNYHFTLRGKSNVAYDFTADEILQDKFLPAITDINRQVSGKFCTLPSHFKLGIIEEGTIMSSYVGSHRVDQVRARMFTICDIILEFG